MDRSSRSRMSWSHSRHKLSQAIPARIHTSIPFTPSGIASPSPEDTSLLAPLNSSESERGRRPISSLVPATPSDLLQDRFFDSVDVLDSKSSSSDPEDETLARGRKSVGQRRSQEERVHRKSSDSELRDREKEMEGLSLRMPTQHTTRDRAYKECRCRAASTHTFRLKHDLPSARFCICPSQ